MGRKRERERGNWRTDLGRVWKEWRREVKGGMKNKEEEKERGENGRVEGENGRNRGEK